MSREFSLVSTKLELEFCKNKKKILAGNWCYQDDNKKNSTRYLVANNPWSNIKVFNNDYKYIKNLLNRSVNSLVDYLNKIHKKKFSKKFWKILILPWLTIYLPSYYYRWRVIKQILKIKKKIEFFNLENLKDKFVPSDSYDFHKNIQNRQDFNYSIFRKIIFFLNTRNKIKIKKKIYKKNLLKKEQKKSNKFIFKIKLIFNNIFVRLFCLNNIFLEPSIFRKIDNLKINIILRQIPTFFYDIFNSAFGFKSFYEYEIIDYKKRNSVKFNLNCKSDFEKFLKLSITEDIPLCFIEGFEKLHNFSKKIKMRPKKIISSYYHYFNELFKFWVAFLKENKFSKFYTVTHGGGGFMKYPSSLNFEKEIADKQIVWYKSNFPRQIQLPASKFITQKKDISTKQFISFVEGPVHLFPSRLGFATIGNENTNSFNIFLKFYNKINLFNKQNLIYLPKKEHDINVSKNLDNFLKKNQIKKPNSFNIYNHMSKLNIISYPQTTFCESIQTTPTILIYEKNKWEFHSKFNYIYKKLIKNKILFHNPVKAALHVNKVSKNIDAWWMQKKVQSTINQFLNDISLISENSIQIWVNKLKTL